MDERAFLQRSQRKIRDRSMVLVLVGTIILQPPIANIFLIDGKLMGLPIPVFYVFVVWTLLVAGAAMLARRLQAGDDATGPGHSDLDS